MNGQIIGKRAIRTNWAVRRPNDEEKKAHTYEQIYNAATSDNTTVYLGNIVPSITGCIFYILKNSKKRQGSRPKGQKNPITPITFLVARPCRPEDTDDSSEG
jgi:hypothetical protein